MVVVVLAIFVHDISRLWRYLQKRMSIKEAVKKLKVA